MRYPKVPVESEGEQVRVKRQQVRATLAGGRTPQRLAHATLHAAQVRTRRGLREFVLTVLPLGRPVAWRARTFLAQPQHDVESRLTSRLEASDALIAARFDQVVTRLSAHDRSESNALRESRKVFGVLRDLVEDQADQIARLQSAVDGLAARLDSPRPPR